MAKEASKIAEQAIEFCRENLEWVTIIGAAAVALIIVVFVIKSIANNKRRAQAAEAELAASNREKAKLIAKYSEIKDAEARANKQREQEIANLQAKQKEAIAAMEAESKQKVAMLEEEVKKNMYGFPQGGHTHMSRTACLDGIVQELSNLSPEILQEVEVKIQGAEVRIKYTNGQEVSVKEQNLEGKFSDKEKVPAVRETELVQEFSAIESENAEESAEPKESMTEQLPKEEFKALSDESPEVVEEPKVEVEPMRNKSIVKFGPSNMNTSRAGHVFSEEELMMQIRD